MDSVSTIKISRAGGSAKIELILKPGASATRLRISPLGFDPVKDKTEYDVARALALGASIVIAFSIPPSKRYIVENLQHWESIIKMRETTPDGIPDNEWWLLRNSDAYNPDAESRFLPFIQNKVALPTPLWLFQETQPSGPRPIASAFPPDTKSLPIPTFPSVRAWEALYVKSLLYEMAFGKTQHALQFNQDVVYRAVVRPDVDTYHKCTIDIKLTLEAPLPVGTVAITPVDKSRVYVFFIRGEFELVGECEEYQEDGYDLRVVARLPESNADRAALNMDYTESVRVNITFSDEDSTTDKRLAAVVRAARTALENPIRDTSDTFPHYAMADRTCGPLLLHDIILDQKEEIFSPDLREFAFSADSTLDRDRTIAMIHVARDGLPTFGGPLNEFQAEGFDAFLDGVRSGILLIEGVPGSGKTTFLARLIMALLALRLRSLITSQSNGGVDALFNKLFTELEKFLEFRHLANRCVRFPIPSVTLRDLIAIWKGEKTEKKAGKYSLASHIYRFIVAHP